MPQIHKQFRSEQVKVLLQANKAGHLSRDEIERTLGIGKTRFFAWLQQYRALPDAFSIQYRRRSPARLSAELEEHIILASYQLVHTVYMPIATLPKTVHF